MGDQRILIDQQFPDDELYGQIFSDPPRLVLDDLTWATVTDSGRQVLQTRMTKTANGVEPTVALKDSIVIPISDPAAATRRLLDVTKLGSYPSFKRQDVGAFYLSNATDTGDALNANRNVVVQASASEIEARLGASRDKTFLFVGRIAGNELISQNASGNAADRIEIRKLRDGAANGNRVILLGYENGPSRDQIGQDVANRIGDAPGATNIVEFLDPFGSPERPLVVTNTVVENGAFTVEMTRGEDVTAGAGPGSAEDGVTSVQISVPENVYLPVDGT